jgi:hypothetical protein
VTRNRGIGEVFRKPPPAPAVNLLDMTPTRTLRWESSDEGRVTLFVPRFRGTFGRRWVQPMLKRPDMRVRLDELGSFVWNRCDGATSVGEIGEEMTRRFGHEPDDAYRRLGAFIRTLARDRFVLLEGGVGASPPAVPSDTNVA